MKHYLRKLSIVLSVLVLVQSYLPYSTAFAQQIASVSAEKSASDSAIPAISQTSLPDESASVSATDVKTLKPTLGPLSGENQESARLRARIAVVALIKKSFEAREHVALTLKNAKNTYYKLTLLDNAAQAVPATVSQTEQGEDEIVQVNVPQSFRPGKYTLRVEDTQGVVSEQTFTWGVLALNSDKDSYHPGETAVLAMAVLDEKGEMVCDAQVSLQITDPKGNETTLSTNDQTIRVSNMCSQKVLTLTPDYTASYLIKDSGVYTLKLLAHTKNGDSTISDTVTASESIPFQIKRISATRLYPPLTYPMVFEMTADHDFTGTVTETVPSTFTVTNIDTANKDIAQVIDLKDVQPYSWAKTVTTTPPSGTSVLGASTFSIGMPFKGESASESATDILKSHPENLGFGEQLDDPEEKVTYQTFGLQGHDGIDFKAAIGTPIVSVDEGDVVLSSEKGDYGTTLVIQHAWGKSYYGHLSKLEVHKGDHILKGEEIALSGNSGISTGPHLHFGIKLEHSDQTNGFYGKVDPSPYLGIPSSTAVLGAATGPSDTKVLAWDITVKKGETVKFGYLYKAPKVSPAFYTLGPATVYNGTHILEYQEERSWSVAADSFQTPALVQVANNKTGSGNSLAVTFSSSVTTGNLVVVATDTWGTNAQVTSVTDTKGNTYTKAVEDPSPNVNTTQPLSIWYAKNVTGGSSFTVTVTPAGTGISMTVAIHEYSGIDKTAPLDQVSHASATGTGGSSGNTATTSQTDELIFGALSHLTSSTTITMTAGTNFTNRYTQIDNSNFEALWTEDRNVTATGTYNASGTFSTSVTYRAAVATFKAAAAAANSPTLDQLMRHGKWFDTTATPVKQPFTF